MKPIWIIGMAASLLIVTAVLQRVVQDSYLLHARQMRLLTESDLSLDQQLELPFLAEDLSARLWTYANLQEATSLEEGMVVNRTGDGSSLDQCDSLLFSSLRYISLKKLGWMKKADAAWNAIQTSHIDGRWRRHPDCREKATSRDMIVGLFAALSQKPPRGKEILEDMVQYADKNGGYIDEGPFYVSRLSPGNLEIMRQLCNLYGIDTRKYRNLFSYASSTMEWSVYGKFEGYRTHLTALALWTELEIKKRMFGQLSLVRSPIAPLDTLLKGWTPSRIKDQRASWLTRQLKKTNRSNLFFQKLDYRVHQADAAKQRHRLLTKLLSMPQFPSAHLPRNCDRKADYLWQRREFEFRVKNETCDKTFSGTDFLWMGSLILDELKLEPTPVSSKLQKDEHIPISL